PAAANHGAIFHVSTARPRSAVPPTPAPPGGRRCDPTITRGCVGVKDGPATDAGSLDMDRPVRQLGREQGNGGRLRAVALRPAPDGNVSPTPEAPDDGFMRTPSKRDVPAVEVETEPTAVRGLPPRMRCRSFCFLEREGERWTVFLVTYP